MSVSTLPGRRFLTDPEVRLMLRVRDGDTEAFAELLRRYGGRVFGYFCRQFGDRAEAEDLSQEVFLRVYRARQRYQPSARFSTWLFRITRNAARNAMRSRRRRPAVLQPCAPDEAESLRPALRREVDPPSLPLERAESAGAVRHAVAGLAGRQRVAVELHDFQGHTYAEVAAELDMTPKAVKSLLYRARNQLRATLTSFMG